MKKLLISTFMLLFLLVPGMFVCAADSLPPLIADSPEFDDLGHVTSGLFVYESPQFNRSLLYYSNFKNDSGLYFVLKDGFRILYSVDDEIIFASSYYMTIEDGNISGPDGEYTMSYGSGHFKFSLDPVQSTNIPVFDSSKDSFNEDLQKYIDNGDISGADNSDDIDYWHKEEYDEEIPLPHNFHVLQGVDQSVSGSSLEMISIFNHDIVVAWDQDDTLPNMQFEIEGQFTSARMSDNDYTNIKDHTGAYHTIVQKTAVGSAGSQTIQISKSTLNAMKEDGFLRKLKLRIRNVVGKKTSNWVSVTIDFKNKTATATEEGYDDSSQTGGDEYNDTDVDSSPGSNSSSDVNIDGLMGFIRSGFGLLGSGGLISLLSSTFSYLPGSIWTIIKFYVSMLVLVAIVGLIKMLL